jgi:hypothetical protein
MHKHVYPHPVPPLHPASSTLEQLITPVVYLWPNGILDMRERAQPLDRKKMGVAEAQIYSAQQRKLVIIKRRKDNKLS